MKKLTRLFIGLLLFMVPAHPCEAQKLLPEMEDAILLVRETMDILDELSDSLWPGWKSYKTVAYFTAIPMVQDLLINPPADPGDGFVRVKTAACAMPAYLRQPGRTESLWGGAYRYKIDGKRYRGVRYHPYSEDYSQKAFSGFSTLYPRNDSLKFKGMFFDQSFYRAIITHEAFHLYQYETSIAKAANQVRETSFSPNRHYQRLAEKEGKILADAFLCHDRQNLQKLTRSFLRVREKRRNFLTPADILWEKRNEYVEGCAMYVETKFLELSDAGGPGLLKAMQAEQIKDSPKLYADENQAYQRCYFLGMAQAMILDRLRGQQWKAEIMQEGVYLEDLLKEAVR